MSTNTQGVRLTDDQFMDRLRKRFVERAGDGADAVAEAVSTDVWRSDDHENDPEGADDDEMDSWVNDGDYGI